MFEAMDKLLKATYKALEPSDEEPITPEEPDGWHHQERMNEDQKEEDYWWVEDEKL